MHLENVVQVWKKGAVLLSQGRITFARHLLDIKPLSDGSLELRNVTAKAAGEYTCNILVTDSYIPKITHTVNVLVPPTIVSIYTANNKTEVISYKLNTVVTVCFNFKI